MDWTSQPPDADLVSSSDWTSKPPDDDLKSSSFGSKLGNVAMGALETLNAPFQIAGESIRGASESLPMRIATAEDQRGYRAPSIAQRLSPIPGLGIPDLRTDQPPTDPFQKIYQGLEGITNLPRGLQAASDVVTGPPDLASQIGGMGLAVGLGTGKPAARADSVLPDTVAEVPSASVADDLLNVPKKPVLSSATGAFEEAFNPAQPGRSANPAAMESAFGNEYFKSASEPGAGMPPPETPLPGTPASGKGPLDELFEAVGQKGKQFEETKGIPKNLGRMLEQKGRGMRLKEIGASPGQVRKLRDEFGEKLVNDLADLADEKGITKGFFNFQTGDAINKLDKTAGAELGTLRQLTSQRGAIHDKAELIGQIRQELDPVFMRGGTESIQKGAYLKALKDIELSGNDVASMANTITDKLKFIAKNKMTLPLGATKKVMQVANRLNNEKAAEFMNPQELARYNERLKDVQAAKIFNRMYGMTYGRDMAGRTGPGSFLNTLKDIGGRKVLEKVYSNVGGWMQKRDQLGSIKELGSEILDSVDDALDEVIESMGSGGTQNKAFGGIVGEMDAYLTPRYGAKQ